MNHVGTAFAKRRVVTLPRPILPGRSYLITRRCTQREWLLRPEKELNQAFAYALGVALEKYDMGLIAGAAMSNHWHGGVHDFEGELPAFMQYFHGLVARALNCKLGRWENFWSVEQAHFCHLVEARDVLRKAVYTLANPVIEHLVEKAIHWPGFSTYAWLDGRTVIAKRPRFFFGEKTKLPKFVKLKLIAPPEFEGSFEEWSARVREGVAEEERAAAEERAKTGRRIVGRKAVRAMSPEARAASVAPRRGMKPFVAAKNVFARLAALDALDEFRRAYAFARLMFKFGWRDIPFPAGTWALVRLAGVSVAPS